MIIIKLSWKQIKNKNMNSCRRIFVFSPKFCSHFVKIFLLLDEYWKIFSFYCLCKISDDWDIWKSFISSLQFFVNFDDMTCTTIHLKECHADFGPWTLDLLLTHTSVVARSLFFSSMDFVVAYTRYSSAALCSFIHNLGDTYHILWEHICCWYLCRTRIRKNWTHRCSAYLQRSFTRDFIYFPNFVK